MAPVRKKTPAPSQPTAPASAQWPWLATFLLLVFLAGCTEIEDPDLWWHLRTGQLIWQRGEIPRTDWFTYTNPDSPWLDLHWGFQLIAAALWQAGGAPALVLVKSVLGTAAFGLLLLATRREWSAARTVACWLPSLLIFYGRNQVRPEMFSFLFLAAELSIAFHARRRPGLVWFWPAIQLLWINVHALFVLGVVVWCCFLARRMAGWMIPGRITRPADGPARSRSHQAPANSGRSPPTARDLRRWLIVSALIAAAALANPYGLEGALFPLTLLERIEGENHDFYVLFSGEFRGFPEFLEQYGWAGIAQNLTTRMIAVVFVCGLASFVPLAIRGRFDLFRVLVFALFAHLCWQANRNSPLFALVGGFVLRANLGDWLEPRPANFSPAKRGRFRLGRVALAGVLGTLLCMVPLDLLSVTRPGEMARLFGLDEIPNAFAHEEAEFLGRPGMPRSCYAIDEGAAAVYIFHNGPERRVFADPRLEVNTRETLERYLRIEAQLSGGDPAAIASLMRDAPAGSDGRPELPALLVNLRLFIQNPALLDGLGRLKQFRRVHEGKVAVVYLEVSQADRLGLADLDAIADTEPGN